MKIRLIKRKILRQSAPKYFVLRNVSTSYKVSGKTGVLKNIAYLAAPRNNGFKMMPNEIETWKVGDKAFEFKGTTGFMVTVDMKSDDLTM